MNNTRFATSIHIMTLLASLPQEWLSSDFIATSININPVVVRKEISLLTSASLVTARRGKEGGYQLAKPSSEITLKHLYELVKKDKILGKKNGNPSPECPVGREINGRLEMLFAKGDELLADYLDKKTLEHFASEF